MCNAGLLLPYQATGLNPYDMREACAKPPLCYDFSNVGAYLRRPEVKAALGVDAGREWKDCNHAVALEFELAGDWMHSFQDKLPEQLAAGIRVLIYAGDQDYICKRSCESTCQDVTMTTGRAWHRALNVPFGVAASSVACSSLYLHAAPLSLFPPHRTRQLARQPGVDAGARVASQGRI